MKNIAAHYGHIVSPHRGLLVKILPLESRCAAAAAAVAAMYATAALLVDDDDGHLQGLSGLDMGPGPAKRQRI